MPNKPSKLINLTCAKTAFLHNSYIYKEMESDGGTLCNEEKAVVVSTQAILQVSNPIHGTDRNITNTTILFSFKPLSSSEK